MSDELQAVGLLPPTPMERAEAFAHSFVGWANQYAIMFGGPLYLVGSYLVEPIPGDVDLRLQLDREHCVLYWGADFDGPSWEAPRGWLARKREELKQSRRIMRAFPGRPRIDFQFQCALFSEINGEPIGHEGKPRLRLDKIPNGYFAAGKGDP